MNNEHQRRAMHDASQYPIPGEGYWYMAGPYSDDPSSRYKEHLAALAILTYINLTVYSPIVHFHEISTQYNMPTDADFWANHDYNMIAHSKGMILLCLPYWAQSKGVRNELTFCKLKSISVWALDPPISFEPGSNEIGTLNWTRML